MRGRRTVCFITLKVREVATYISRPSALTRERKKKPRDRFLHHGKRSSPSSESENERFREWWMTRAGSLANCEQAKCSSGFTALGWRRSECGNQPCDPTVENRGPCDRIRYIYIYIYENYGASESDRSWRRIKDERANHQCGDARDNVRPRPS